MVHRSKCSGYRCSGGVTLGAGLWSLLAACGGDAGDRAGIESPAAVEPAPMLADPGEDDVGGGSPDVPSPATGVTLPEPPRSGAPPSAPACGASGEVEGSFELRIRADVEQLAGCVIIHGDVHIYATALDQLAPLSSLQAVDGLFQLGASNYVPEGLPEAVPLGALRGLEGLARVGRLFVTNVVMSSGALPLPALRGDVQQLVLSNLPGVTDLQAFASLRATGELNVEMMPDLVTLAGARVGPDLETLSVWYSPRFESLAGVNGLERLQMLWLVDTPALARLDLPEGLTELSTVDLSSLDELMSLAELSRFTTLEELRVSESPLLADLGGGVAATGSLRTLMLHACPSLRVLDPVGGLGGLVEISLVDCDGITELDGLGASLALERLEIRENDALARLPVFDQAESSMIAVRIVNNASLVEGPQFPNLVTLYEFDAANYQQAELMIEGNPQLRSIGSFPRLESSSMVTISGNPRLDAAALPSLQSLFHLRVTDNDALARLELALHERLGIVTLSGNPALADVTLGAPTEPLHGLTLLDNPLLPPAVRQQLLGLVGPDTEVELD
jgi:hypothetical protein